MSVRFIKLPLLTFKMLKEYLLLLLLGAFPISECRGAIVYGFGMQLNPWLVFILAIIGNIIAIPIVFKILKVAKFRKLIIRLFGKHTHAKIEKHKKKFEAYEELALLFLVAIPFPLTGAYTGILISEILDLNRKKATIVISIGVIIAAIITFSAIKLGLFLIE